MLAPPSWLWCIPQQRHQREKLDSVRPTKDEDEPLESVHRAVEQIVLATGAETVV